MDKSLSLKNDSREHLNPHSAHNLSRSERQQSYRMENEEMFLSETKATTSISGLTRTIFLILVSSILNGYYYHLSNLSTLQSQIESTLNISEASYGFFATLTAAPSAIVPIFFGGLIDKIGAATGLVIGTCLLAIGDGIVLLGFNFHSVYLIYAGCLSFGFGTDITVISQIKILQKWFRGKDLSLALGVSAAIGYIMTVVASILGPVFYRLGANGGSLMIPIFIQFAVTVCSFIISGFTWIIDKRNDHVFKQNQLIETSEKINFRVILSFPKIYWYMAFAGVLGYSAYMGTSIISSKFLETRFGFSNDKAGVIRTIPQWVVLALSTPMGKFTDVFGKKIFLFFIAQTALCASLITSAFLPDDSTMYVVGSMFVVQGFFAALNTIIPYASMMLVIKTQNVGIAYGFYCWMIGIILGSITLLDGVIIDATVSDSRHGYFWIFIFLAVFPALSLLFLVLAKKQDNEIGGVLDSDPKKVRASIFARSATSIKA